jgi:hypothetical protein
MRICYVDESGCTGVLPTANSPIQPVCVIAGVVFNGDHLRTLTFDFLNLKKRFFPNGRIGVGRPPVMQTPPYFLDWVLPEVGGCDIRVSLRHANRNPRRHGIGFLDRFVDFLDNHGAKVMGRILVKQIGQPINGRALYTSAIQTIFEAFQNHLDTVDDVGVVVLDGRTKPQNVNVAHSLFTQKFR